MATTNYGTTINIGTDNTDAVTDQALPAWDLMNKKRTARVVLVNDTSKPLVAASIVHKYSDVYKDKGTWAIIMPGESSSEMTADYITGLGTTGRDWWLVQWFSEDIKTRYYSKPNNFQLLEKVEPVLLAKAAAAGGGLVSGSNPAAALANKLAELMANLVLNEEGTEGFKMYILRGSDEKQVVKITIKEGGLIDFNSPSGCASTVYKAETVYLSAESAFTQEQIDMAEDDVTASAEG